jgi:hypothetical protein
MKYKIVKRRKNKDDLSCRGNKRKVNLVYDNFLSSYFIKDKEKLQKAIDESLVLF